jgi:hypothetical protein
VAKLSLKKFNVLYFKVGFELKTSRWYIQYLYYNKIMNFYWTLCKIVLHYFVNASLKSSIAKFTNTKYWVFCQKKIIEKKIVGFKYAHLMTPLYIKYYCNILSSELYLPLYMKKRWFFFTYFLLQSKYKR